MNRKLLVFALLGAALLAVPLISKMTRGDSAKEVDAEAVTQGVVQSSILASGTLAYRQQVQLRAELIAKVKELHVEEGDRVSAGDLVIRLDPEAFTARVEQQEAAVRIQRIAIERQRLQIENLQRRFERNQELFEKKLVDEDTFDALENELALARVDLRSREEQLSQAQALLSQAREELARTEIRSPIDGIVIQADVKVGETVIAATTNIPGSTLVTIADPTEMLTEVQVDEADIAQVSVEQRADVYAAAHPDRPLPGRVESIATIARRPSGQQSLSFLVKILLDDSETLKMRPGMSARTDIYTETSEQALKVPVQAVRYDEGDDDRPAEELGEGEEEQPFVMLIEGEEAVRRDVRLGISSDADQEILDGLSEGEMVITGPYRVLRHLKDGDRVKVRDADTRDSNDAADS